MKNNYDFMENIGLHEKLSLQEIPEIDLYMDQVIQLFENKFKETKRTEGEKVLTKTMINNYAKAKVFFPIRNKKYTKRHMILLSLIYQLKGSLSINEIKGILDPLNERIVTDDLAIDWLYETFLKQTDKNAQIFTASVEASIKELTELIGAAEGNDEDTEYYEELLVVASLAHMSQLYKRAAERLADKISENRTNK
ncbi:DUF1836 domain-containing protein [Pradoshia sp.]